MPVLHHVIEARAVRLHRVRAPPRIRELTGTPVALRELVEDVVVALAGWHIDHARPLQQVVLHLEAVQPRAGALEVDLGVLPEPRGVVVAHRLRVAERLEQLVGVGEGVQVDRGVLGPRRQEVLQHLLVRDRLPRPRLPADHHRLARRGLQVLVHLLDGAVAVGPQRLPGPVNAAGLPLRAESSSPFGTVARQGCEGVQGDEHGAHAAVYLAPRVLAGQGVLLQVVKGLHIFQHGLHSQLRQRVHVGVCSLHDVHRLH
mmetsp:Transcript_42908/g.121397  ORF Transcript_42908/g.121397 Transcript_42908/m.121397 type:complete len:258 (+) Transcript_42908:3004-3777(+)